MRRDPFGQRPLYYAETSDGIRAAPSVRALAREAHLPLELDTEALAAALCGVLPPGRSLFRGVRCVPPGHELRLPAASVIAYWEPPLEPPPADGPTAEAAAAQLLDRLRSTLGRMRSAPRTACSLSGGLDSAVLLTLLAEEDGPIRAWTLADDFGDGGGLDRARALAELFGAEHAAVTVSEDTLPEHLPATVRACEELLWNGGAVARYLFFRAVREGGDTAIVSGVGADEVLCGNPEALRTLESRRQAERDVALSLLRPSAASRLGSPLSPPPDLDPLLRSQHVFLRTVLPESTLPPECRTSAALGVEVHLPYLEPEVAELALRLPLRLRVVGDAGKWVLRQAAQGLIPEAVRTAPKQPRLAPAGGRGERAREAWLAFYARWLSPDRVRDLEVLEPRRVAGLLGARGRGGPADPERSVQDAVLMKLASAAVLQAWEGPALETRADV